MAHNKSKKSGVKGCQILYSCTKCHTTKTATKRPKCSKCKIKMVPVMR